MYLALQDVLPTMIATVTSIQERIMLTDERLEARTILDAKRNIGF
jgi:hypothetical protein